MDHKRSDIFGENIRTFSSETLLTISQITRCHNSDDRNTKRENNLIDDKKGESDKKKCKTIIRCQ
jgi:hypothetical protein